MIMRERISELERMLADLKGTACLKADVVVLAETAIDNTQRIDALERDLSHLRQLCQTVTIK